MVFTTPHSHHMSSLSNSIESFEVGGAVSLDSYALDAVDAPQLGTEFDAFGAVQAPETMLDGNRVISEVVYIETYGMSEKPIHPPCELKDSPQTNGRCFGISLRTRSRFDFEWQAASVCGKRSTA